MDGYLKFLESKKVRIVETGIEDKLVYNDMLFPFQRFIVEKALRKGRYAIFADCGLGKTLMQLEWARHVYEHTGAPVLILCPLAVAGQTVKEGEKFGIPVGRINRDSMVESGIWITNYEQLENVDASRFSGIVLDESSMLKNFEGKYKNLIIDTFAQTPFKLACTATPSPNDPTELCNHAEFLGVMSRQEMLAMYFVHDGGKTSSWRLKGHAKESFYAFVAEWASMLGKPSDIGFEDTGYNLPPLNILEKTIKTSKRHNNKLFNDISVSAVDFNLELRLTKIERLDEAVKIVQSSDENFIIWIKQNEEGDLLRKLLPGSVEVRGNEDAESKESKLIAFANNKYRVLITKAKIAQFGLNFQNCNNQIFASIDFSFESLYQSIRRSYRFGQKNEVNIYIITTDTMQNVIESIRRKQQQFLEMQSAMTKTICSATGDAEKGEKDLRATEYRAADYDLLLGDCVQRIQELPDESIGFSIFSPPFNSLYVYSDHIEDMGNSATWEEFTTHFGYLIKELFRVMHQGRNVAIHCMDLPIQKGKEGYIGLRDFSGMILRACEDAGFIYHSRVTIWKDPVTEMQRTKALGLLHKQTKKDAAMCRVGLPDYLLVFRKPGEHKNPVTLDIPVELWQKYASPVWYDINYSNTLNKQLARDAKDERHICPLQLETIERCIALWSNKGDTVFTPFMGIGSEVYKAIEMGRKAIGIELKESYFDIAVKNAETISKKSKQKTLFSKGAA